MTCGADTLANTLLASLTAGVDFTLPDVDLTDPEFSIPASEFDPPVSLTNGDLTTGVPTTGTGTFDIVMKSIKEHLRTEYEANRITGAEFTKAYIELTQAALGNSVQFLLGRDTAYWAAVQAQMQARIAEAGVVKARVELEIAKAQLAATVYEASNQQASYALTKMKLSTESVTFCTAEYNLANILPAEKLLLDDQHSKLNYEITQMLPAQKTLLDDEHSEKAYNLATTLPAQTLLLADEHSEKAYNLANIMPAQKLALDDQHDAAAYTLANILPEQKFMLHEQGEAQRAQTLNVRQDAGGTVVGLIGKQKDLYTQQIESYKRDAEVKAAKLFTDAWITQKTIDEGLLPPTEFQNTSVGAILADIKTNNALG